MKIFSISIFFSIHLNLFGLGSHPVMDARYPVQAMTERALRLWQSSQDDDDEAR